MLKSFAISCSFSMFLTHVSTRSMPSPARCLAIAYPMPLEAPVTRAFLPINPLFLEKQNPFKLYHRKLERYNILYLILINKHKYSVYCDKPRLLITCVFVRLYIIVFLFYVIVGIHLYPFITTVYRNLSALCRTNDTNVICNQSFKRLRAWVSVSVPSSC